MLLMLLSFARLETEKKISENISLASRLASFSLSAGRRRYRITRSNTKHIFCIYQIPSVSPLTSLVWGFHVECSYLLSKNWKIPAWTWNYSIKTLWTVGLVEFDDYYVVRSGWTPHQFGEFHLISVMDSLSSSRLTRGRVLPLPGYLVRVRYHDRYPHGDAPPHLPAMLHRDPG